MIRFRRIIYITALLIALLNTTTLQQKAFAEEISANDLPNSGKTIRFNVKDKPLSYAIKKLAYRARLNIAIAPDFNDSNISISSNKISIARAFETLSDIGNFVIDKNDDIIIIKNREIEQISTNSFSVNNIPAEKLAYVIDKTITRNQNDKIDIDQYSNTLIIKGNEDFVKQVSVLKDKLDIPKKHSSLKLEHYTSCQVANILNSLVFNIHDENKEENSRFLAPVFDEKLGFVLKGLIEKSDQQVINSEKPIIIPENNGNEITIIGNEHQVNLAKEVIEYLEGKKTDKDEIIREAHNEIYNYKQELKETKKELEESKLELADTLMAQVNTEVELKEAKEEISNLHDELNKIKADKSWQVFFNYNSKDQSAYIEKLESEITNLKKEINKGRIALSNNKLSDDSAEIKIVELSNSNKKLQLTLEKKETINEQLANELIEKDQQLTLANEKLKEIKAQLAELELKKNLTAGSNDTTDNLSLITSTLEDLQKTKTELNKVQTQLEASKQQLELIFGGKLLDKTTMPNNKSIWFN
ncbi:MAG: hypothetical protein AB7V50_03500 [Vampirovibrionia bacterium]